MPVKLKGAAAVAALSTALAACSVSSGEGGTTARVSGPPGPPAASPSPAAQTIAWGPCTDLRRPSGQSPRAEPAQQCGKLRVPLDYAKPDGESVELALIRYRAGDPGRRIGSLVFNFGGPGASGVDTLAQASKVFATLNARYDLVSFDPRGVERSSGVRCDGSAVMDKYTSMNTPARDATERAETDATTKEFVTACMRTSGKLLPHVGTVNAARDMDRIRAALGDARLHYFGISYGTQLGAVYATQFPRNVGRFVLDAPLDPSVTLEQRAIVQTRGFQKAYEAFLRDCVREPGQCEIGSDRDVANKNVDQLLDDLRSSPIPVGDRRLTQGLAGTAIAAALYSELTWPLLDQGLGQAIKQRDGRLLMALADNYNGRQADGRYTTLMSSFPAISCVDTAERPDRAQLTAIEDRTLKISPLFGGAGMGAVCSVWPVPGDNEAKRVDASGSAPIVVIGGTGDPATPYEWAPKLTDQLKTGVLVTYKGEGHGAYLSGDACVKKVTDDYLLGGKVPETGTTCPTS
ncbi:pimeloyl-ACP methyl ester carboxylesterase [Streptosporangium becharense]|uniref:Pimeloyl-ACP methyl ester carboxylesterase n=1 Tax=Streptosporangium becharense TaxID=1816182 RepID=A0A7W9IK60_9ACTN|nr:alpha/beta hydrolase [Streptosporangium becharense]MBB2913242.1 pimeloyl-ACP methyl ester carboxylesterase [Streptosporangium becharense]MBB5822225.1 pimeloyl-ACP methyl ester carboxylesterase [Streptosporangium becharense]